MKATESQIGMGIRFACGIAAIAAVFFVPVHRPGASRDQIVASGTIALAATVCMAVQMCRGRLWHRIVAGVLLLFAGALVIGIAQEWIELAL